MFHLVSYKRIREIQVIPEYVVFYKNLGFYLEGVLQSWIIVQLVSLKKFGSDSQMGYDDGV